MSNDVVQWLKDQGFGEYSEEFTKNKIDMDVLPFLTNDDLKDAGVIAVGDRRKLLRAIESKPEPTTNAALSIKEEVSASRRQVTVLFTDISGFTRISNGMDAEETHAMLNGFFAVVDSIIERYGGTVDKHIGDAVMAIFGAPISHTDDPERALLAASDIHRSVKNLEPPLSVHVGVASGQVVASSTGSTSHTEYTVTGDSVNLAARLTDLAETSETLLSSDVQRAISDQFICEPLGARPIDGLSVPVDLWRLNHISEERASRAARFVGRKRELGRFEAAAAHCLDEEVGETLIIRGEAGIGKTQLLKEIERSATDSGFSVHTGMVLDFGTGKGQDAIRALVRSLLTIEPGSDKKARSKAADTVIEKGWLNPDQRVFLNDLLDLLQPTELHGLYDAMDNATRNKGRQEILADLVRVQSENTPILLLIEDMHWASSLIKDHVARLANVVEESRSLMVLTTRPNEGTLDDTWLAAIPPAPFSIIDLGPLADAEVTALSEDYDHLAPEIKKACIERSGGNPLFLEQLLRNVADLGANDIPGTLLGIVQARLDTLSPQDRKAIEAASVLGQRFDLDPLRVLISDQTYQPTGLISATLLRPAGEGYLIAHALIRDGVYATLLSAHKKSLHMSAASWFADKDLGLHAEHLGRARDVGAARAFLAAALEQQSLLRFDVSIRLLKSGLEQELNAEDRFDIQYQYADLLAATGDYEGALTASRDAMVASYDDTTNCLASIRVAEFLSDNQGETVDESLALLEKAEVIAKRDRNVGNLFRIHENRRAIYHASGDGQSAMSASERMLKIADQIEDPLLQSQAYLGMIATFYTLGKFISCEKMLRNTLRIAIPNNFKREELGAHFRLGISRLYNGSAADCLIECDRSLALADRYGLPRVLCLAHEYKARTFIQLGDYQSAETEAKRSLEVSHSLKQEVRSALANIHLSSLQRTLGNKEDARRHAEYAVEHCRVSAPRFALPWSLIALSDCLEDASAAQACREEALDLMRTTSCTSHNYFHVYARLIDCALDHGDWDEAEKFATLLADYTKNEPLVWTDFVIDRGRVLVSVGRGEQGQETTNDLQRLLETGSSAGLLTYLPRLETALSVL